MEHKNNEERFIDVDVNEIKAYVDSLFDEREVLHRKEWQHLIFLSVTAVFNISVAVFFPTFSLVTSVFFWGVFFYGIFFVQNPLEQLHGRIDGCFTTLEILGMIDKGRWTKRKKPKFSDLFALLTKRWTELKEKMRREPYGKPIPALAKK